jgi:hypothetical protein
MADNIIALVEDIEKKKEQPIYFVDEAISILITCQVPTLYALDR